MANVVRFVLESQRNLYVPGAGQFVAGVLDVDAVKLDRVALVRFLVTPYGAKEYGTVDSSSTAPTLPAVPLPPSPDPLPMYALDTEVDHLAAVAASTPGTELYASQRAASGSVAGTVTAAGVLVVQKHNPVDATAGALTMTLPTGAPEGSQLSVEKADSSTNLVTITGSIRGSAGSIPLAYQRETLQFRADANGSWFPVAGHRTKASLEAAFLPVGAMPAGADFMAGLGLGQSRALAVFGDSTGADVTLTWPRRLLNLLAADYPGISVDLSLWIDANQAYGRTVPLTTGKIGTNRVQDTFAYTGEVSGHAPATGAAWTGTTGQYTADGAGAVSAGTASVDLFSDGGSAVDARVVGVIEVVYDSNLVGKVFRLYAKQNGTNRVEAYLTFDSLSAISLQVYKRIAGTPTLIASTAVTGIAPSGTAQQITMTLAYENGEVTAAVGSSVAGGTLTGSDATAVAAGTAHGFRLTAAGRIKSIRAVDTASLARLRLLNGSVGGTTLAYQLARLTALFVTTPHLVILNSSHNYSTGDAASYTQALQDTIAAIRAFAPAADILVSGQNPESAPRSAAQIAAQQARQSAARSVGRSAPYLGYLPIYETFARTTDLGASRTKADGIHPTEPTGQFAAPDTTIGQDVWAATVRSQLLRAA